jgi:dolichyl-phosphate beta-glucosyltransferase
MSAPWLSVVIPAFNEERRLLSTLKEVDAWLRGESISFEVQVVDDGSTDATASIAEKFAADHAGFGLRRLSPNRGKGAAVREGLALSRGEVVLFTDADLSTPLFEFRSMMRELENGADVVLASRALPDSNLEIRQAWYRESMGRTFNRFVRLVTGIPFLDTQCGFKIVRGGEARALAAELVEEGFAFDVELILLARRRGLSIVEVGVTWRNDEASRVNPVRDSFDMLGALPRILGRTGRYRG